MIVVGDFDPLLYGKKVLSAKRTRRAYSVRVLIRRKEWKEAPYTFMSVRVVMQFMIILIIIISGIP